MSRARAADAYGLVSRRQRAVVIPIKRSEPADCDVLSTLYTCNINTAVFHKLPIRFGSVSLTRGP